MKEAVHTDNCSTDAHAVLAIYVVLHSRREVFVADQYGGPPQKKIVNDCDVYHFFGNTISKGKKNDHVFHNACLEAIVKRYQRKLRGGLKTVKIWTDNCGGHYKNRFNFWKIATAARVLGVLVSHGFAQKYGFKGIWDAAGKVVKDYIRKLEVTQKWRFPNALECFIALRHGMGPSVKKPTPYNEYEKNGDPRILDKGHFVTTRRFFGFVTDDKEEFKRLGDQYRFVLFADRENIPWMETIKGTHALHSVVGASSGPRRYDEVFDIDAWRFERVCHALGRAEQGRRQAGRAFLSIGASVEK